jgi:hypothetical protein
VSDTATGGGTDPATRVRDERWIGVIAMALAVIGIVCLLPLPWQVRFPLLAAAALYGPGVPVLRLWTDVETPLAVVVGVGVDVALLMVLGEFMVLIHLWVPAVALALMMVASFVAGAALRSRAASSAEPEVTA